MPSVMVVPLGSGPELALLAGTGTGSVTAAIWPGVGAQSRTIAVFGLSAGASTIELRHDGEAVYYVRSGAGAVRGGTDGTSTAQQLREGAIVHVARSTNYRLTADGGSGLGLVGGPCPPDPSWFDGLDDDGAAAGSGALSPDRSTSAAGAAEGGQGRILVLDRDQPELMLPIISSDARMIAWPGNGAWVATMNYVRMKPGEENQPHVHPESEDTIVILEGRGTVDDLSAGRTLEFSGGDVIHVPAGVRHAVRANRGSAVVSAGGPCPADIGFLRACGAELPDRPHPVST
jgi:quercetin dioxygenase-like cupin family protein